MAVIDPQGLFFGERLAACSDLAQLYWPRLFLAANGLARMELSHSQIISDCFRNFHKSPKEAELWQVIAEYEANFLAVTYEAEGTWWLQFNTSERLLPRHKTKKDLRSPAPPNELMERSRAGYLEWKRAKGFGYQRFQKSSETSAKFLIGVGVGNGDGVGDGDGEEQKTLARTSKLHANEKFTLRRDPAEAIYDAYPRKVGKSSALKAIARALKFLESTGRTPRDAQEYLYRRTQSYARSPAGQSGEFTPHPSTWFNRGSFDDDEREWQRAGDATRSANEDARTFGQRKADNIRSQFAEALGARVNGAAGAASGADHPGVGHVGDGIGRGGSSGALSLDGGRPDRLAR